MTNNLEHKTRPCDHTNEAGPKYVSCTKCGLVDLVLTQVVLELRQRVTGVGRLNHPSTLGATSRVEHDVRAAIGAGPEEVG